jgi:hypothetical protein
VGNAWRTCRRTVRAWLRRFALWLLARVDGCPTCGQPWTWHPCPAASLHALGPICTICGVPLPVDAIRRHDGAWRCRLHKQT